MMKEHAWRVVHLKFRVAYIEYPDHPEHMNTAFWLEAIFNRVGHHQLYDAWLRNAFGERYKDIHDRSLEFARKLQAMKACLKLLGTAIDDSAPDSDKMKRVLLCVERELPKRTGDRKTLHLLFQQLLLSYGKIQCMQGALKEVWHHIGQPWLNFRGQTLY